MRAGWAYFAAWPDTANDFAQMAKAKLTMPVLSIAGEKASAAIRVPQMKLVATTVTAVDLRDTGHWLMEERPDETMEALIAFRDSHRDHNAPTPNRMFYEFVRPRDLCQRDALPDFKLRPPRLKAAVKSLAACIFASFGKSSLPSKNTRIFLNAINQKGIFGVALSVA
jgi:hypothetical protein